MRDHDPGHAGVPRLREALASLECTVERLLPGGDHVIVLGRVRAIVVGEDDHGPARLLPRRLRVAGGPVSALAAASTRFAGGGPVLVAPDDPAGTAFVAAPAESITAAGLETLGGGMILLALDDAITRRLGLPEVRPGARPRAPLPFVVPIDAAQSPARRWSVVDPALTMRVAAAADSGPDDLAVPGRVQPVGATRRRLLDDGGSVSAALALAHHAGRREAVALCAGCSG